MVMSAGGPVIDFDRPVDLLIVGSAEGFCRLGKFEGDGTCMMSRQPKHGEHGALTCRRAEFMGLVAGWGSGLVLLSFISAVARYVG